jgi:hypothetical protein
MPKKKVDDEFPLFPTEAQIGRAVFGTRAAHWRAFAMMEERRGLPQIDPMAGARYWPAVRAYLDRRAGLIREWPLPADRSVENWDEETLRRRRMKGGQMTDLRK